MGTTVGFLKVSQGVYTNFQEALENKIVAPIQL
jgi:hypothetical protein